MAKGKRNVDDTTESIEDPVPALWTLFEAAFNGTSRIGGMYSAPGEKTSQMMSGNIEIGDGLNIKINGLAPPRSL